MANRKGNSLRNKKASDMASYTVSSGNFWDIDNYHKSVKRIGESSALCDDLVKMFSERAEIESKYGKKLGDWHEKWSKVLDTSCLYATMKTAALGTLKEAEDRATLHMDCCMKINNQVVETIKRWKESNYHHKLLGIKEAKDFEQDFAKAQKPWAIQYNKVQRAKVNYHNACKHREVSLQNLNTAKNDPEFPPEKVKKLEESLRKVENTVSTMQQKYDEKLKRMSPLNVSYEDDMRTVYGRWAKGEEKRKEFIQRTLVEYHQCVNIYSDPRLKELYDNQLNVAYSGKTDYDVNWWAENFGTAMPRNWPKFEGYSPLDWHHWNLRHLASVQAKQSRRYTTRPRPYSGTHSQITRTYHSLSKRPCNSSLALTTLQTLPLEVHQADDQVEGSLFDKSAVFSSFSRAVVKEPTYENMHSYDSKLFRKELGDEPDHSHQVTDLPEQQQYRSYSVGQPNGMKQPQPYQPPVAATESNPFVNGDERDTGDDDDEWEAPPPTAIPGGGVPVRALYDYTKVEDDELSFCAGDILTKLTEEDEQGWCKGRLNNKEGLYPHNYVEPI